MFREKENTPTPPQHFHINIYPALILFTHDAATLLYTHCMLTSGYTSYT